MEERMKPSTVVLLSGGVDSSTLLVHMVKLGYPASALFVDYGQPALGSESRAAKAIAAYADVGLNCEQVGRISPRRSGEFPGRNALLVLRAATLAEGPLLIGLGIHAGTPYPDCGVGFIQAMQAVLDLYHGGSVQLIAPFVAEGKTEVIERARSLEVPLELCHSCEKADVPCGACLSCQDARLI